MITIPQDTGCGEKCMSPCTESQIEGEISSRVCVLSRTEKKSSARRRRESESEIKYKTREIDRRRM